MGKDLIKINRALISVYNKTSIVYLAKELQSYGCEIISTGGTAKALSNSGINYTNIESVTGNPEAFNGKMKTISFNIESALLFDRDEESKEAENLDIKAIDMVVCNLYPFREVLESGADLDMLIENIDIGGPTMIRAGAKNFRSVVVLTDVGDYQLIIDELKKNDGCISYETRKRLMRKAFNHTADYDSLIASAMDELNGEKSVRISFNGGKKLRYGENSHQEAYFYKEDGAVNSLYDMELLHGKELSFNNIMDINAAVDSVRNLNHIACAVIKHNNPCGIAEGSNQREAFEQAWGGDPVSAFGSVVAFNRPVDKSTVDFLNLESKDKNKRKFIEVIVAPMYSIGSISYLMYHKNLRIVQYDMNFDHYGYDLRYMNGALLVQDYDEKLYSKMDIVTKNTIDIEWNKDLIEFGLKVVSNIKSNAIAVVREHNGYHQLLGMGAGQPNRVIATKLALDKSCENLKNDYQDDETGLESYIKDELSKAVLVSDAFFPFEDNVELAFEYGIKTIVQPGGSIRDKHIIKKCDDLKITMIFTGLRHFKH